MGTDNTMSQDPALCVVTVLPQPLIAGLGPCCHPRSLALPLSHCGQVPGGPPPCPCPLAARAIFLVGGCGGPTERPGAAGSRGAQHLRRESSALEQGLRFRLCVTGRFSQQGHAEQAMKLALNVGALWGGPVGGPCCSHLPAGPCSHDPAGGGPLRALHLRTGHGGAGRHCPSKNGHADDTPCPQELFFTK